MKRAAWILTVVFGLAFLGATLLNADLIGKSREALASGVLRDKSSIPPARYHLIVVIPDSDDSFFRGLLKGINDGAAEVDAAVQIFSYPGATPAEAERYFELSLKARVDGLIMYIPRNDSVAGRAERAARNGVVFVPVGTDAPLGTSSGFIGSSSLEQGLKGGSIICASLGSSARIGVILPATSSGDPQAELLYRGIATALRTYPGSAISGLIRSRTGVLSGEEAAAAMFRSYPSINALFCSTVRDTIGAAQVVVELNKVGKVLIVGVDETPEILRYIDKGVIAATIVRNSHWIGMEAVRAYYRAKAGQKGLAAREAGFVVRTAKGVEP
ncbi:MAG: substrate-binding domain-containing protein [Spirochaetes bacterium]|nr:substrate-binding domain-containing protein [Spirochaetota bacterium]